jgi:hypothetical protein
VLLLAVSDDVAWCLAADRIRGQRLRGGRKSLNDPNDVSGAGNRAPMRSPQNWTIAANASWYTEGSASTSSSSSGFQGSAAPDEPKSVRGHDLNGRDVERAQCDWRLISGLQLGRKSKAGVDDRSTSVLRELAGPL